MFNVTIKEVQLLGFCTLVAGDYLSWQLLCTFVNNLYTFALTL